MMRRLHTTRGGSWFAAWVLFTSLLFGPLGVGPGALAAPTATADACCAESCPGGSFADVTPAAQHEGSDPSYPEDPADEQCPLGCDDCACCPGALICVATRLSGNRTLRPHGGAAIKGAPDAPTRGILGRIFRPPEPAPV